MLNTTNTGCVRVWAVLPNGDRATYLVKVPTDLLMSAAINYAEKRLTIWLGFKPGVGSSYQMVNETGII